MPRVHVVRFPQRSERRKWRQRGHPSMSEGADYGRRRPFRLRKCLFDQGVNGDVR